MFSKSIHAARARITPPSNNQVPFTAKPSSCYVHTPWMTPPTSYSPTLSADTEPKHTATFLCSVQYDIIKSALESFMTRLRIYHVKNDSKIICRLYWSWLIKDDSAGSPLQLRSTRCGGVKCKRSWWLVTQIAKKPGSLVFILWSASISMKARSITVTEKLVGGWQLHSTLVLVWSMITMYTPSI